jgi:O-antigen/teichoic acid export membrane protein
MTSKEFQSDSSVGRMMKNGFFVALRFGLYTLSGVIFIPYLLWRYGEGSYGLIALAGFLTQYVGLISKCVGNAIARFLNISLNQNNWDEANEIFSTALVANVGFILVQIPVFALGIWKLDILIDFPAEIGTDFRILVGCNVLVFFLAMLTGVIRTPIQASNRLDISEGLGMIRLLLRIVVLIVLIETIGPSLWYIGVVDLVLALANAAAVYSIYRKLAHHLVFKWRYVSRKWIRPVLSMAVWSVVSSLGGYFLFRTDVWMVNRFVSKEMAGIYAALLVWPNYLKQISKQLATILVPVYMIDHAKGDNARVARMSLSSAKMLGCIVALGTGLLIVAAEPLLELWLRREVDAYVSLFRIMVGFMAFVIGESVLWQIYVTLNKVHFTGVVSLISGVLNIALSLLLIHFGMGAYGVAIASIFVLILYSSLAIPLGVCREFKVPYRIVFANHASAALLMLISAGATAAFLSLLGSSVLSALAAFSGIMAVGLSVAYWLILTAEEKALLLRLYGTVLAKVKS